MSSLKANARGRDRYSTPERLLACAALRLRVSGSVPGLDVRSYIRRHRQRNTDDAPLAPGGVSIIHSIWLTPRPGGGADPPVKSSQPPSAWRVNESQQLSRLGMRVLSKSERAW
jgi:hypothetical protein